MGTLHLNLIKLWFELIKSGEKKEEYREITDYWAVRLLNGWSKMKPEVKKMLLVTMKRASFDETELKECIDLSPKEFEQVHFKNGMSRHGVKAPCLDILFDGLRVGTGNQEWGAEPGKRYFVIELGQIN